MSDDLIERLRNFTEEDAYATPWTFGEVVREAADEITRLRAEVERLRGQAKINNKMVNKTANDVVRYKSRAERAEAALSDERAHADVLAEAVEMFATDRNWQQGGPFDPCSPSFTGTSMASAVAKQHHARRQG